MNFDSPYRPIDLLRERFTRGIEVRVDKEQVGRGDTIEALVRIEKPGRFGLVEVGLVCTEAYAVEMSDSDGGSTTGTSWATQYEVWFPLEATAETHTVELRVPTDAPYSYEGGDLSFTWEVVARSERKLRVDARAACALWVRP
ncbi:MAG: hypothetical protein ACR2MO_13425 [Acidimicrobiales bacterium]